MVWHPLRGPRSRLSQKLVQVSLQGHLFESPTIDGGDALEIDGVVDLMKDTLINASAMPLSISPSVSTQR